MCSKDSMYKGKCHWTAIFYHCYHWEVEPRGLQSITGHRDKQASTLTRRVSLDSSVNLTCAPRGNLHIHRENMQSPYRKLPWPILGLKPGLFSRQGDSTNPCTTMSSHSNTKLHKLQYNIQTTFFQLYVQSKNAHETNAKCTHYNKQILNFKLTWRVRGKQTPNYTTHWL